MPKGNAERRLKGTIRSTACTERAAPPAVVPRGHTAGRIPRMRTQAPPSLPQVCGTLTASPPEKGPSTSSGFHPPGPSSQPAVTPVPTAHCHGPPALLVQRPQAWASPETIRRRLSPIRHQRIQRGRNICETSQIGTNRASLRSRRIRRRNLVTGHWSLLTGHCSLVTGHWFASMRPRRIRRGNPPLWGPGTARHSRPPASAALHRDIIGQGPEEAQHQFAPCYCVFKELIGSSAAGAWSVIGALAWCRQAHTTMGSFSMT